MTGASSELGRRIRAARLRAGLTQEALAAAAEMDRSSLTKVETGVRRITALELARLAASVGERIEWFLDDGPEAIVARRTTVAEGVETSIIDRYVERVARNVEFVATHAPALRLTTPEPLDRPTSASEVEQAALAARALVGLDRHEPMLDIGALAASLGLLVFTVDVEAEGADGASILLRQGGVAVVNGRRQVGRRRLTAAHELAHYLFADGFTIDWRIGDADPSSRWEAQVDHFARALLLPVEGMRQAWKHADDGEGSFRTFAIRTASEYRVDMATLARRLQELRLTTPAESQRIRDFHTTRTDIVEMDLLVPVELEPPDLPRSYESAVVALYRSETISAARAMDLLLDTWQEDDLPELAPLPESAIWTFVS